MSSFIKLCFSAITVLIVLAWLCFLVFCQCFFYLDTLCPLHDFAYYLITPLLHVALISIWPHWSPLVYPRPGPCAPWYPLMALNIDQMMSSVCVACIIGALWKTSLQVLHLSGSNAWWPPIQPYLCDVLQILSSLVPLHLRDHTKGIQGGINNKDHTWGWLGMMPCLWPLPRYWLMRH